MSKHYKIFLPILVLIFTVPSFTLAQFSLGIAGQNFKSIVMYIISLIDILNPILFSLAFLIFFWGLSKFILSSGNQADIEKGKNYMLWGILALFILLTFRAIISIVSGDLEFGNATNKPLLPTDDVSVKINGLPDYLPSTQLENSLRR